MAVAGLDMDDLAELAGLHELCGFLQCGRVAITEVHHIDDAGLLCGAGHARGIGVIGGERFFAKDVFAGSDHLE